MAPRVKRDHSGYAVPKATSDGVVPDGWLMKTGTTVEALVSSGELDPRVGERILRYRPRENPYRQSWPFIAAFVVRVVLAIRPPAESSALKSLQAVTRFSHWARQAELPLEEEVIFVPERVDQFVSSFHGASGNLRNDHRTRLRAIGRKVTRKAAWPSNPERFYYRSLAVPYGPEEVELLAADIEVQSPSVRRAAEVTHYLGLGVGPRPGELIAVTADDLVQIEDVWCVKLGAGSAARPIPILPQYVAPILGLAERYPTGPLAHSRTTEVHVCDFLWRFRPGNRTPMPVTWRYRSTWLLAHLAQGTRLDVLTRAAGVRELSGLHSLLPHLPQLDDAQARQWLIGGGR